MTEEIPWHERTAEEAIEPDLLICDPHHHLWDLPGSRYLVDELLQEIGGGHRVTRTVFVECLQMYRTDGPTELQPVGETEFVARITRERDSRADDVRVAAGIVGFADLTLGPPVQQVIEAHMRASKRFRGLRYTSAWDASERIHNSHTNPRKDLLQSSAFRAGFACLSKLDLSFDAWVYHPQIPELADLARAFPEAHWRPSGNWPVRRQARGRVCIMAEEHRRARAVRKRSRQIGRAYHDHERIRLAQARCAAGFGRIGGSHGPLLPNLYRVFRCGALHVREQLPC